MKDLGDLNNWTKTDLARVIVQAINDMPKAPPADFWPVKKMVRNHGKAALIDGATHAIEQISRKQTLNQYSKAYNEARA